VLESVTATRFVLPLREGGSLPGLVEADDLGTYVVKFTGAGQGRKALIAEIIAGELARRLGFRVPDQVILDCEPYRRLAFRFHTFTPEMAAVGLSDETLAAAAGERRSKVAFTIEPYGDQVKLTVVQDDFEPGSTVLRLVSDGWPVKLSSLKTGLEQTQEAVSIG
jgi:hypothetical protein